MVVTQSEQLIRDNEIMKIRLRVVDVLFKMFNEKLQETKRLLRKKDSELVEASTSITTNETNDQTIAKQCSYIDSVAASKDSLGTGQSTIGKKSVRVVDPKPNQPFWGNTKKLPAKTRSIMLTAKHYVDCLNCIKYLTKYGTVVNFYEPLQKPRQKPGYKIVFLKFETYDSAAAALAHSPHKINNKWIYAYKAKDF